MKTKSLLICVLISISILSIHTLHAQEEESKDRLFYTSEVVVKPNMVTEHETLMKDFITLCTKHNPTVR